MWCEYPTCGKQNLGQEEVIFDQNARRVVCRQCFGRQHPQWAPPVEIIDYTVPSTLPVPSVQYEVTLNNREGFKARISYGELSFGVHAPMDVIQRWRNK